jgi:hypothetical protein
MDPVKRQTILREIEHWRSSKLLPEHYCDFLKNLYVEGNEDSVPKDIKGKTKGPPWKNILLIAGTASFILFLFIYFTSFHPLMQTVLCLLFVGASYAWGFRSKKNKPIVSYTWYGIGSLSLLFLGDMILDLNEWTDAPFVMGFLALCGTIWVLFGIMARVSLLHFCGWVCLLMSYVWLIQHIHSEPGWLLLQTYTVPVCLVLFIAGKNVFIKNKSIEIIMLIASAFFWFTPEIYGIFLSEIPGIILQPALALKVILGGLGAWLYLRKTKPTEWLIEHE